MCQICARPPAQAVSGHQGQCEEWKGRVTASLGPGPVPVRKVGSWASGSQPEMGVLGVERMTSKLLSKSICVTDI